VAALVGTRLGISALGLLSLCSTQPLTRWLSSSRCWPITFALALVSVCPTGRRVALPTGCPTSIHSHLVRRWLLSAPSPAVHFDCSANSDPAGTHPGGHALPRYATDVPVPASGRATQIQNLAGWLLHCLVGFALHGPHTGTQVSWWVWGFSEGQSPATQHCTAWNWGMPGRPGPGFRLRCVQSVSVTW
jgi:hypothetical protein